MAEIGSATASAPIRVSIVWLAGDWPEQAPMAGGKSAFGLHGHDAPETVCVQLQLEQSEPVHDLLQRVLNEAARARWATGKIGVSVFGRRLRGGQVLCDGDRIELLGPILADPKSSRRARVKTERDEAERSVWTRR